MDWRLYAWTDGIRYLVVIPLDALVNYFDLDTLIDVCIYAWIGLDPY